MPAPDSADAVDRLFALASECARTLGADGVEAVEVRLRGRWLVAVRADGRSAFRTVRRRSEIPLARYALRRELVDGA